MLKNNKGQITIFVVIGIILVIVASFFYANSKLEFFVDEDSRFKNQINDIVEQCLFDSTSKGVFLLGFQGGVIDVDTNVRIDPKKYIDLGLIIPNWDSTRQNSIPTIESMEEELNNYIENETLECVKGDLNALDSYYDILVDSQISANSQINSKNVRSELELLIKFSQKNSEDEFSINDYSVILDDTRLGDLYELAAKIYNHEIETNFVETLVLDQIYSSSDYSSKDSMPSEGMSFSCSPRVWTYSQLKENLANLNNHNFKYLQIEGTYPIDYVIDANLNEEFGTSDLKSYYQGGIFNGTNYLGNYRINIDDLDSSFEDYKVDIFNPVSYNEGNPLASYFHYREFEVSPSNGQIVKPINMKIGKSKFLKIPCLQIYHHLYNLDYDLVVKLTDFNEDGYGTIFQFPIRVVIKNNNEKVDISQNLISSNVEPLTLNEATYCSNESYQFPTNVYAYETVYPYKESNGNWASNDLESLERGPLTQVNVSINCLSLSCDMGSTSKNFNSYGLSTGEPSLNTNMPYCIGGTLIGEKNGYHSLKSRYNFDSSSIESANVQARNKNVYLLPLKEFDLEQADIFVANDYKMSSSVSNLREGSLFVSVENSQYDFDSFAIWPVERDEGTGESYFNKLSFLDLAEPASYNISIIYTDSEGELIAMLDYENFVPKISDGNRLSIGLFGDNGPIAEENFISYYNRSQTYSKNQNYINRGYGLNFK